jgi:hypothetical protein
MPGGNNTSTRPVSKPGQPNPVKTIQTLLAAKKKDTSNKEPRAKKTHSEVSSKSEVLTRSFVISFRSSFVVTSLKPILISSRSF